MKNADFYPGELIGKWQIVSLHLKTANLPNDIYSVKTICCHVEKTISRAHLLGIRKRKCKCQVALVEDTMSRQALEELLSKTWHVAPSSITPGAFWGIL